MTKQYKLLQLLPALWASVFDITITVIHQPKEYWNGNLAKANEGNPIGAFFMESHVSGLFVISALWLVAIAVLGYVLPKRVGKIFLLFCVIAHSYGASTWLSGNYGFWYAMAFILFNSILYSTVDHLAVNGSRAAAR